MRSSKSLVVVALVALTGIHGLAQQAPPAAGAPPATPAAPGPQGGRGGPQGPVVVSPQVSAERTITLGLLAPPLLYGYTRTRAQS